MVRHCRSDTQEKVNEICRYGYHGKVILIPNESTIFIYIIKIQVRSYIAWIVYWMKKQTATVEINTGCTKFFN